MPKKGNAMAPTNPFRWTDVRLNRAQKTLEDRIRELEPVYIRAKHDPQQMLAENAMVLYTKLIPLMRSLQDRPPADGFSAGVFIGALLKVMNDIKDLPWPNEILAEWEELKKRQQLRDQAEQEGIGGPSGP